MQGENMIERRIGYQVKRAEHALRSRMDQALREIGLTTPQYAALSIIEVQPGLSGKKIAQYCFVTPQSMNLILINLEEAKLIVRHPHPEFGRLLQAYLTPAGKQLVDQCHQQIIGIEDRMIAFFSESQRLQFLELLCICADALEADNA